MPESSTIHLSERQGEPKSKVPMCRDRCTKRFIKKATSPRQVELARELGLSQMARAYLARNYLLVRKSRGSRLVREREVSTAAKEYLQADELYLLGTVDEALLVSEKGFYSSFGIIIISLSLF